LATRAWISAFGMPCMRSPKAMFSATDMCGYSAYDWNTIATPRFAGCTSVTSRPLMWMLPALGASSPAINRSSVDLPHPDGPTNTTSSPGSTERETSSMTEVLPNFLAMEES
jgi:hypothetical protein